jgi:hypothetical protein
MKYLFRKGGLLQVMKEKFTLEKIIECLSCERIHSYFLFAPKNLETRAVIPYDWIQALSSMLFVPLQYFEITLRNRIHETLSQHYRHAGSKIKLPGKAEDWLLWMPANKKISQDVMLAIKRAKQDIDSRQVVAGDIISRLYLGTWVRILEEYPDVNSPYHFWSHAKARLFPNLPGGHTRHLIFDELKDINTLRNRLFHYEPVWNYDKIPDFVQGIAEIRRKYNQIMKAINWMSSDMHNFILQSGHVKRFDNLAIEISSFLNASHKTAEFSKNISE